MFIPFAHGEAFLCSQQDSWPAHSFPELWVSALLPGVGVQAMVSSISGFNKQSPK